MSHDVAKKGKHHAYGNAATYAIATDAFGGIHAKDIWQKYSHPVVAYQQWGGQKKDYIKIS